MTNNNESLGLAGWLFADLLLGLVVIFLAIGYVFPGDDSSEAAPTTTTSTTTTTTTTPTTTTTTIPLTTTTSTIAWCDGIESPREDLKQRNINRNWAYNDPGRLIEEIDEFLNPRIKSRLKDKRLTHFESEKIRIGYVLVWAGAGPDPTRDEERGATKQARDFIEKLEEIMPERFKNIDGRASWGRNSVGSISMWYFPRIPSTDCP